MRHSMEIKVKDCDLLIRAVQNGWLLTLFKAPIYITTNAQEPRVEEFVFVFDKKADLEDKIQELIDNPNNVLSNMTMTTS
jgi:hypothetical protein